MLHHGGNLEARRKYSSYKHRPFAAYERMACRTLISLLINAAGRRGLAARSNSSAINWRLRDRSCSTPLRGMPSSVKMVMFSNPRANGPLLNVRLHMPCDATSASLGRRSSPSLSKDLGSAHGPDLPVRPANEMRPLMHNRAKKKKMLQLLSIRLSVERRPLQEKGYPSRSLDTDFDKSSICTGLEHMNPN
jgi:hypothetical protein